jgi:hypothetical protein
MGTGFDIGDRQHCLIPCPGGPGGEQHRLAAGENLRPQVGSFSDLGVDLRQDLALRISGSQDTEWLPPVTAKDQGAVVSPTGPGVARGLGDLRRRAPAQSSSIESIVVSRMKADDVTIGREEERVSTFSAFERARLELSEIEEEGACAGLEADRVGQGPTVGGQGYGPGAAEGLAAGGLDGEAGGTQV